jgi:hypothetical protein
MAYLDKYKNRLGRNGNNVGEKYANNTIAFIEATFSDSPTFRILEVVSTEFPETVEMDARVVEVERMGTLRQVLFRPYQGLNIGSYVKFDNSTWLVFDQWGEKDGMKYVALVEKCNRTLKWKSKDGVINDINCIASQSPLGSKASQGKNDIEWNKYDVSLPLGQLYVFVEKNRTSDTIQMNQRFIFGKNVYEVFGIDDISFVDNNGHGIIQLMVKIDIKRDSDDFENRIAFNDYKLSVPDIDVTTPPTGNTDDTGGSIW